jgi:hypothetical protein
MTSLNYNFFNLLISLLLNYMTLKLHKFSKKYVINHKQLVYVYGYSLLKLLLYISLIFHRQRKKFENFFFFVPKLKHGRLFRTFARFTGNCWLLRRWNRSVLTNVATMKFILTRYKEHTLHVLYGTIPGETKRERRIFSKKFKKVHKKYFGVKNLGILPNTIILLSLRYKQVALNECTRLFSLIFGPQINNATNYQFYLLDKIKEVHYYNIVSNYFIYALLLLHLIKKQQQKQLFRVITKFW